MEIGGRIWPNGPYDVIRSRPILLHGPWATSLNASRCIDELNSFADPFCILLFCSKNMTSTALGTGKFKTIPLSRRFGCGRAVVSGSVDAIASRVLHQPEAMVVSVFQLSDKVEMRNGGSLGRQILAAAPLLTHAPQIRYGDTM